MYPNGIQFKIRIGRNDCIQAVFNLLCLFRITDNAPGIIKTIDHRHCFLKQLFGCNHAGAVQCQRTMTIFKPIVYEQTGNSDRNLLIPYGKFDNWPHIYTDHIFRIFHIQCNTMGILRQSPRHKRCFHLISVSVTQQIAHSTGRTFLILKPHMNRLTIFYHICYAVYGQHFLPKRFIQRISFRHHLIFWFFGIDIDFIIPIREKLSCDTLRRADQKNRCCHQKNHAAQAQGSHDADRLFAVTPKICNSHRERI